MHTHRCECANVLSRLSAESSIMVICGHCSSRFIRLGALGDLLLHSFSKPPWSIWIPAGAGLRQELSWNTRHVVRAADRQHHIGRALFLPAVLQKVPGVSCSPAPPTGSARRLPAPSSRGASFP